MTRRCCLELLTFAAALTLLLPGSSAAAAWHEELQPAARERFDLGLRYFATQQYASAIEEFRAAFVQEPHPKILYTLGQTYRLSGDCPRAIEAYKAYLRTGPPADLEKLTLTTPVAPAPAPRWYADPWGMGLALGGLASCGAGGVAFFMQSESVAAMDRADRYSSYQQELERAERARLLGIAAVSVGGALVAGAIVRYVLVSTGNEAEAGVVVTGPGQLAVRF